MGGHYAIKRGRDARVAEIDGGECHSGLLVGDVRAQNVTVGPRLVDGRLRCEIASPEAGLPVELRFRLSKLRLRRRECRLRLLVFRLVRGRLDGEQRVALPGDRSVSVVDAGEHALNPGHQINGVGGRHVAGHLKPRRHQLPQRLRDADPRRRGRHEAVLLLAAGQQDPDQQRNDAEQDRPRAAYLRWPSDPQADQHLLLPFGIEPEQWPQCNSRRSCQTL